MSHFSGESPPTDALTQIELLKKKNLLCNDDDVEILQRLGYYRLIKGYRNLFLKSSNPSIYQEGTTFDEIHALYLFNHALRISILDYIFCLEVHLRAIIIHEFALSAFYKNHLGVIPLRINNFRGKKESIQFVFDAIIKISKRLANPPQPIWIIAEEFTFAQTLGFLKMLPNSIQHRIYKRIYPSALSHTKTDYPDWSKRFNRIRELCNDCSHSQPLHDRNIYGHRLGEMLQDLKALSAGDSYLSTKFSQMKAQIATHQLALTQRISSIPASVLFASMHLS